MFHVVYYHEESFNLTEGYGNEITSCQESVISVYIWERQIDCSVEPNILVILHPKHIRCQTHNHKEWVRAMISAHSKWASFGQLKEMS